jgi:hypothetical protein
MRTIAPSLHALVLFVLNSHALQLLGNPHRLSLGSPCRHGNVATESGAGLWRGVGSFLKDFPYLAQASCKRPD